MQSATAQYTSIPDANFEQALFDLGIDTVNGDNQVLTSDISGFTSLDVSSKNIADLTGIEGFTSLEILNCSGNQMTSLNVSANTTLTYLDCGTNNRNGLLTSLDVSLNTALTHLKCSYNHLPILNVSANTALTYLDCEYNQLTSLDVSANTSLTYLNCSTNQLPSLDVSANVALIALHCSSNYLPSLYVNGLNALQILNCHSNLLTNVDVSGLTALLILSCSSNHFTSLDVSANTALTSLGCSNNQLTILDVSANISLNYLDCYNNQLTSLDVSANSALIQMWCNNNPNLTCIKVSDVAAANANSWDKDDFASYSLNCNLATNTEIFPKGVLVFPNPAKALLTVQNNHQTPFDKIVITDLTGKIFLTQTTNTTQINVEPLASGMYILEATSGENKFSSKFVKE